MSQRFNGKIALVTGAGCVGPGWGNGRAIAYGLAREGATVIGVDRSAEAMVETAERIAAEDGRFESTTLDVTDGAAIGRLVGAVHAASRRVRTAAARAWTQATDSVQPRQASVMLWP